MNFSSLLGTYGTPISLGMSALGGISSLFGDDGSKERNKLMSQALQMMAENKKEIQQGITDAEGNRYVYIGGKGFVIIPADYDKMWQKINSEKTSVDLASKAMNKLENTNDLSENDIANILMSNATKGINDSLAPSIDMALRQGNRTGSNIGSIMEAFTSEKQKQTRDAIIDAQNQARLNGNQINLNRKQPLMQEYQEGMSGYNNSLSGLTSQGSNMMNALSSNANAMSGLMTGQAQMQQGGNSFADKFGSILSGIGTAVGSYSSAQKQKNQNDEILKLLREKIG